MAFLEEQEWILFNEITYNVHYIYKVEDLLRALLDRWIRFLIPYDAAVFSRLSVTEDGALRFIDVEG